MVFVDPTGFSEIRWDIMERLCSIEKTDIFFTFMTPFIALNRKNAEPGSKTEQLFDDFYGNPEWRNDTNGDALFNRYKTQIEQLKNYVYEIPVFQTGSRKLYDIIIATDSDGASNIIEDAKKIMDVTTTELLEAAFSVATNKSTDLSGWQ